MAPAGEVIEEAVKPGSDDHRPLWATEEKIPTPPGRFWSKKVKLPFRPLGRNGVRYIWEQRSQTPTVKMPAKTPRM
jgi:hypothetical protein